MFVSSLQPTNMFAIVIPVSELYILTIPSVGMQVKEPCATRSDGLRYCCVYTTAQLHIAQYSSVYTVTEIDTVWTRTWTSGFRRCVNEICALLGLYAA